jgi:hypothetical protein
VDSGSDNRTRFSRGTRDPIIAVQGVHMRKLMLSLIGIAGLFSLTGCVVYGPPRPVVYVHPAYEVYPAPVVVYGGYYHRGYYR